MSRFRVVFFGTPEIAVPCLTKLFEDEHYEIVGVVTQPDRPAGRGQKLKPCPVKVCAEELGLEVLTAENVNTEDNLNHIKNWKPESAVVIAFGQILSPNLLALFSKKLVNLHASLLPRWRGAAPIQRALEAGDKETGVTLQIIVPKLDAGDVLGFRRVAITPEMTAATLYEEIKNTAPALLETVYADFLRGHLTGVAQDSSLVTQAKKVKKEEGLIVWTDSSEKIFNRFRAFSLWPKSYTYLNGNLVKILGCSPHAKNGPAGQVLELDSQHIVIGCGEGSLAVTSLQSESRAAMAAPDFVNGYGLKIGNQFSNH